MVNPHQGSLTSATEPREAPVPGVEDYQLEKLPFGLRVSALEYQEIVSSSITMSSDKTTDELKQEIDALTKQLEEGLRVETDAKAKLAIADEKEYQALLKKMVGRRVLITVDGDALYGKEAIILKPRGKSKHPMCWWLKFLNEPYGDIYKARTSFKLLPKDDTGH